MKLWAVGAVVSLFLLLPVGGIAQAPLTVDIEEPEFLVIFNLHSESFDIYANEYPGKPPSTGATHYDYEAMKDAGAYEYEAESLYLGWQPEHRDHAPDGQVDAEIQVPKFDLNRFVLSALAVLMDAQLKRYGCGVDVSHMETIVAHYIETSEHFWAFEGPLPRGEGYDGLLEYCLRLK